VGDHLHARQERVGSEAHRFQSELPRTSAWPGS
jgi:hypothetical protein